MRTSLTLMFLLLNIYSFSQDHRLSILLSPLCLIDDFSFPTIQGGIEIKISNRITFYNEFGGKYREGAYEYNDTSLIQSTGYKYKSEIRYYLKSSDNKRNTHQRGLYLGANVFYIKDTHNGNITYYPGGDKAVINSDYFAVEKNVWGFNAVMGWHQVFKKHLILDPFWGLGVRFRTTENFQREYDPNTDEAIFPREPTVYGIKDGIDTQSGTSSLLNIIGGVRIGYRF